MHIQLSRRQCHREGSHILTIGKMKLYAGSNQCEYDRYSLVINLTGSVSYWYDKPAGIKGATELVPTFLSSFGPTKDQQIPQLIIPWKDGGIPDFTKAQWMQLIGDLGKLSGRVLLHCIGGHGRTGTASAILLVLSGTLKKDPVAWLRKNYCEEAVETERQIKYIQSLGVNTTSTCSRLSMMPLNTGKYEFIPYTWSQEQYDLTKGTAPQQVTTQTDPMYTCILCRRKQRGIDCYQTFLDMTGVCWSCHQLTGKVNPDVQSA